MEEIMLSIVLPVYNHEKYIAQALDSVLMQKTKYSYEVLVGEDASADNTGMILKEYEKTYPGKFKVFYREKNMFQMGKSNSLDLRQRAKGKYLVFLEGDDFWTDENKIERQISFLEEHPDYIAVAHNCVVVGETSAPNGENYPECKDGEYTLGHFLCGILPGQLATVMTRNYMREPLFDTSILKKNLSPGDKLLYFALAANGRVHCIQEVMSAYRHVKKGGSSFSATYRYNFPKEENWYRELLHYARSLQNTDAEKCAETLYFAETFYGFRAKYITFSEMLDYHKNIRHKFSVMCLYIRRAFRKRKNQS